MKVLVPVFAAVLLSFVPAAALADCPCLDAAGNPRPDAPLASVAGAAPNSGLVLCGKAEKGSTGKTIVTNATVNACGVKEPALQLGPDTQAEVEVLPDVLALTRIETLPTGKNWTWETQPFARYELRLDGEKVKTDIQITLRKLNIPKKEVQKLLDDYEKARFGAIRLADDMPYKLLCAALAGSADAGVRLTSMKEDIRLEDSVADAANAALQLLAVANAANKPIQQ